MLKIFRSLVPESFRDKYRLKKIIKKYGILAGKESKINNSSFFEGGNSINNNTEILDSYLGYGSYISNNSIIRKTKIGRYCAIGDYVRTCIGMHPASEFVSIHPAFFSTNRQAGFTYTNETIFEEHKYIDKEKKYVVEIGNDVWIGNNVIIFDGIKIGDGAIIAAGAIVTKDVSPYTIVGGIPAKLIKSRFDEKIISFLNEFKWWNKDKNWIQENAHYFRSIDEFYKKFNE
ncbi:MAG: CatB-related O-acetyltransferase [Bacteroidota bacterium]|nr:CatB-related O-acetyltransferase [Bacteroidota bacterium]